MKWYLWIWLVAVSVSSLQAVTERVVNTANVFNGCTTQYTYAKGDSDFDKTGLLRETVYEDERGYPAQIELMYNSGVKATATMWENAHIHTLDTVYPDHREIDYYDLRQVLAKTEVMVHDSLRETRFYDDSLHVTSIVNPMRDGRNVIRYFDEQGVCRIIETLYPDGRKETHQAEPGEQERVETISPEGHGRINYRPLPGQ